MKRVLVITLFIFINSSYLLGQTEFCPDGPTGTQGNCSFRIGKGTSSTGNYGFAGGFHSTASGEGSVSLGYDCNSIGNYSFSQGYQSEASNLYSVAIGYKAIAGSASVALGYNCISGHQSYAIGFNATSNIQQAYSFGTNVKTLLSNSMTIGCNKDDKQPLTNYLPNSMVFGVNVLIPTFSIVGPPDLTNPTAVGKVGINLANPAQEFHVNGDLLITGTNSSLLFADETQPANDGWGKWGIEYETNGLNFWKPYEAGFSTMNHVLFLNDRGNVGIGTNEFEEKFHVEGNAKISRELTIGDIATPASLLVNGSTTLNGDLQNNGNIDATGNCNIGGILKVSSLQSTEPAMIVADENGILSVSEIPLGDQMGSHIATEYLRLNGNFITNDEIEGTDEGIFISTTGNVGIKTNICDDDFTITSRSNEAATLLVCSPSTDYPSTIWSKCGTFKIGLGATSNFGYIYGTNGAKLVTFTGQNKVGIGVNDADMTVGDHSLYVGGGITTDEVKVRLKGDWSDYVFDDNYKLPKLKMVELFINENKHLPDIPDQKTIYSEGLNLGEMDAMLLKKIEELTLYIIELNKEIEKLKNVNQ